MAKDRGWIKVYRKIQDTEGYFDEPFCRNMAWIDMLLLANHENTSFRVRGIKVPITRGQIGYTSEKLSVRWKWSRGKVIRFLKELQNDGKIVQQKNNITTLISIVKYGDYQSSGTANSTADDTTDGTAERQQTVQQTDIEKNVLRTNKNDKEEIESEDSSEKQVFAEDKKKVCSEVAVVKKVKGKSKKDPDAEPYWKELVKIWFSFNIEKFGEKPSFTGQDPSCMHRIIEQLKKRAEEQNVEWTIQEATERWKRFLYNAFFDEWLSHNFLLQNLFNKKDIIFLNQKQLKNGTHNSTPRPLPRSEGAIKLLDQLAADIGINR